MTVLDASALIAWLRGEPGAAQVERALDSGASISAVNLAEVLSKVAERGGDPQAVARDLAIEGLQVEPYGPDDAVRTALLRPLTRAHGLSLGDRACLTLGQRSSAAVLTADAAWSGLPDLGVTIQLIR